VTDLRIYEVGATGIIEVMYGRHNRSSKMYYTSFVKMFLVGIVVARNC
jgi:hypothetical protein